MYPKTKATKGNSRRRRGKECVENKARRSMSEMSDGKVFVGEERFGSGDACLSVNIAVSYCRVLFG